MSHSNNELDIVCFHVGGAGDYSHINCIGHRYPKRTVYVAFEARDSDDDLRTKQEYLDRGIRTILIQKCVSDRAGTEKFHVNKGVASSSMYKAAADAQKEHMPDQDTQPMWGSHAATDHVIELEMSTIDELIREYHLPDPDILSIDAQGAEYGIMAGGADAMEKHVLSVITEVEFHRIYENQPLFHHQFELLHSYGFRLLDIMAMQYWHPLARVGHGMLTVGEALFIRFNEQLLSSASVYRLIKLAAIALAYKRLSIAVDTINFAIGKFGSQVEEIIMQNQEFIELLQLRQYVMGNMGAYNQDAYFFERDETIRRIYGAVDNLKNRHMP